MSIASSGPLMSCRSLRRSRWAGWRDGAPLVAPVGPVGQVGPVGPVDGVCAGARRASSQPGFASPDGGVTVKHAPVLWRRSTVSSWAPETVDGARGADDVGRDDPGNAPRRSTRIATSRPSTSPRRRWSAVAIVTAIGP